MQDIRDEGPPPQGRAVARERSPRCGSFIVDRGGIILGFDLGMESLTGWPAVEVVGRNKDRTQVPLYPGTVPLPVDAKAIELRLQCRDGRVVDVEAVATRLQGGGDRVAVSVHRVIARSANPDAAAPDLVERDPVTGLPGPGAFQSMLEGRLRTASAIGKPLAVVLADVDHFRRVNDRLGHAAGNETLRKIAGIVRATVEDDELLARIKDDDFAILLMGAGRGEARQVAARLRSTVERFRFFGLRDDETFPQVTLSLGAASYPADADNARDLLERSREALEEARAFGRNRVWCYLRRPRVPVQVPVYFDGADSALLGFSLDLSPSGIFVQTRTPIDIGMRCALAFPLPGAESNVHAIGRIVRTVPPRSLPPSEPRVPGMGIEFERLGPTDRRTLETFLHRHESDSLRPENGTFSF